MQKAKTNWQAWILSVVTAAATVAWYLTGRSYTGEIGSIIIVLVAACCAASCVLYIGRALGNRTLSANSWLQGFAAFGTILTMAFGAFQFILDIGGVGNDFDYAVGWGVATVATGILGWAEVRQAGHLVSVAAHQVEEA